MPVTMSKQRHQSQTSYGTGTNRKGNEWVREMQPINRCAVAIYLFVANKGNYLDRLTVECKCQCH